MLLLHGVEEATGGWFKLGRGGVVVGKRMRKLHEEELLIT